MRETTRHRHAFDRYIRMGADRSLERLRLALREGGGRAPSLRTLEEWSRQLDWQVRVDDFERRARQADEDARVQEVREMTDRHVREALLLQQRGAEWAQLVPAERIVAGDAIRAIVEGVKLERLARDEATDHHIIQPEGSDPRLKGFSDDELRALVRAADLALDRNTEA